MGKEERSTEGSQSIHSNEEPGFSIPPPTDRWGFVARAQLPPPPTERSRLLKENRRLLKWVAMRSNDDFASLSPERRGALSAARRTQLERRIYKGIPDAIRGLVWQTLSGSRTWDGPAYSELRDRATAEPPPEELDPAIVDQIELDLNRTFPSHFLWLPTKPQNVMGGGGAANGAAWCGGPNTCCQSHVASSSGRVNADMTASESLPAVEGTKPPALPGGKLAADDEPLTLDEPFEMVEHDEPTDKEKEGLHREMMASLRRADTDASDQPSEPLGTASNEPSEISTTSSSVVSSFSSGVMEGFVTEFGHATGEAGPPGVDLLRTLLRMYALHDSEVLYCQSMNFVAGTLLMYMTPDVAFRTFAHLLGPLGFRRMYLPGLPLLLDCLEELQTQMDKQVPKLALHLQKHSVHPSLFATQWFMTFGLDQFPFAMGVRLLDLVFYERSLEPLFRVSIALLKRRQKQLVAIRDPSELMRALRQVPSAIDDIDNLFARDVHGAKLKLSRQLLRVDYAKSGG